MKPFCLTRWLLVLYVSLFRCHGNSLLYCADCGGKMYVHRINNGKRVSQYTCSNYTKVPCGTLCPTQHRINESAVLTLVSDTLRAIAEYSRNDRTELWALACWVRWSFSLFRKMEFQSTFNHPLCGCASIVIIKNYLSIYNKVVQAILQKGKVIYGEERKFTRTYEMDVQISYRLHTKV